MNRISEISLEIYPRKIWVIDMKSLECNECFIKSINSKFKTKRLDGTFKSIYDGYSDDSFSNVKSVVIETINHKNYFGIIIFLLDKCDTSAIVHESVHIADYIFESLGMIAQDYSGKNEQYAYLVEYIFSKINQIYERRDIKKSK